MGDESELATQGVALGSLSGDEEAADVFDQLLCSGVDAEVLFTGGPPIVPPVPSVPPLGIATCLAGILPLA